MVTAYQRDKSHQDHRSVFGKDHSDRNEISVAHTGKLKYVLSYRNILSYVQAVIAGHKRLMSEVRD